MELIAGLIFVGVLLAVFLWLTAPPGRDEPPTTPTRCANPSPR